MDIEEILQRPDSVERTAALACWVQSLYDSDPPVLVGGSAVELYTGGAYRSGDLDFVGEVTPQVATALAAAGFRRSGRHWVHEAAEVFLEFPSSRLSMEGEELELRVAGVRVRAISPEALVVDRLAAWQHWRSAEDGVNAWLLLRIAKLEARKLDRLATAMRVTPALAALSKAAARWRRREPTREELERWAHNPPSE